MKHGTCLPIHSFALYDIVFQMKDLFARSNDVEVDEIIEKMLIRSNAQPYSYSRTTDAQQLTSQQHLWHYKLQQQNVELEEKIKNLTSQLKKKNEHHNRSLTLHREINSLRAELSQVIKSNAHLQEEINQMRLKNSSINDSIRNSLDESIKQRKHNRSCSCASLHHPHKNVSKREREGKVNAEERSPSPEKEILKTKKDVSVSCTLGCSQPSHAKTVQQRKEHIKALRRIVENQEKLITSYTREIEQKRGKEQLSKNKTMQSTSRLRPPIERAVSYNTFKANSSAAGSIVKMRRN